MVFQLTTAVCFLSLLYYARSYPSGAPFSACANMYPQHGVDSQPPSESPFTVATDVTSYAPGDVIKVNLSDPHKAHKFKGFLVRAHRLSGDTEQAVGTFFELPNDAKGEFWYPQEEDYTNCVTHTVETERDSMQLHWRAPPVVSLGDIVFRVTFVEQFHQFYVAVTSPVVKATVQAPPSSFPKLSTSMPDLDLSDCGAGKGCLKFPSYCQGDSCTHVVTWHLTNDRPAPGEPDLATFEVKARSPGYVAVGLSRNKIMGDTDTVSCIVDGDKASIQRGYNPNSISNNKHRIVEFRDLSMKHEDGYVYCRYQRPVLSTIDFVSEDGRNLTKNYVTADMRDGSYYIFVAWGVPRAEGGVLQHHKEYPVISKASVHLWRKHVVRGESLPIKTKVHGSLMLVSWMLLASLSVVVARHYKDAFQGKEWFSIKIWFQLHRACAMFIFLLTATAFTLIFTQVQGYTTYATVHAPLGITVVCLMGLQIIMGLLRPGLTSSLRVYYNWAHRITGQLTHITSAACMLSLLLVDNLNETLKHQLLILLVTWITFQVIAESIYEGHLIYSKRISPQMEQLRNSMEEDLGKTNEGSWRSPCLHLALPFYFLSLVAITASAVTLVNCY